MKKPQPAESFFAAINPNKRYQLRIADTVRPAQAAMADHILLDGLGVTVHSAPTGTGKTLGYLLPSFETGARTIVLTATKALQDQIMADFGDRFFADLRGARNFSCVNIPNATCDIGHKAGCPQHNLTISNTLCPYMQQFRAAGVNRFAVTNYAMWFALRRVQSQITDNYHTVVCDEAHALVDLLTQADTAEFHAEDAEWLKLPFPKRDLKAWREWAQKAEPVLAIYEDTARRERNVRLASRCDRVRRAVDALSRIPEKPKEHVIYSSGGCTIISPVWPKQSWERYFSGIPSVVLTSATITREICSFLGFRPGRYRYWEYDSGFPPENAPVYLYSEPVLKHGVNPALLGKVLEKAVHIAGRYPQRGIVFTGSYERTKAFMEAWAQYGDPLRPVFTHANSVDLPAAIEAFRQTEGALLVSPSISTGYDFPDDLCRFIVVIKAPYPDMSNPIVRARMERNQAYMDAQMALTLVQVCGRGVRHEGDLCDCYVLDGAVARTLRSRPGVFPEWFRRRIQSF
jgi:Rad3-related DNA helicase